MADLTSEINQMMGQSCYAIPDDVDEEDLMHELDALEDDLSAEPAMGAGPSYLQVWFWAWMHSFWKICLFAETPLQYFSIAPVDKVDQ